MSRIISICFLKAAKIMLSTYAIKWDENDQFLKMFSKSYKTILAKIEESEDPIGKPKNCF